jgi:predicted peroxiredoxin
MVRRLFLSRFARLAALPFASSAGSLAGQAAHKQLKIMMKSAWGSDDPTKAAFPFLHGLALTEAGHEVQIFLLGEAVGLMRKTLANAVTPVGWPQSARRWIRSRRSMCRSTLAERALVREE